MSLQETETSIKSVAEKAGGAIVGVGRRWGLGSGVVIGPQRVLTNAHNLRGEETIVVFADGRSEAGRVAGVDVDADLAVVTVEGETPQALDWAEGEASLGDAVFALANPGGRGLRVTHGFVSSTQRSFRGPRGRRITGSVEHSAPLVRGSSGGPIVDDSGRVLGINTNRLGEGFYLAVPADATLKERVDALGRGESPSKPRLGVGLASAPVARKLRRAVGLPEAEGLLVRVVEEDGAADRAGIKEGDLITHAGGRALTDGDELYEVLDAAGSELSLKILRGAEQQDVTVRFAAEESS